MPKPAKGEVYKKHYTEENLKAAIEAVRNGMSKRAASSAFGIPRGTLQFRLQGNYTKIKPGPPTVLTDAEENTLVEWITQSSRKGFPRRKEDLLQSVADFLKQSPRPNSFIDNKPGDGWYKLFLKRHPEIVHRTAESVTSASANVSEENIKKWFRQIETCLTQEECLHILRDPKRIFNGDETNFLLCPKTSKVLAPKGTRDVYEVDNAPAKYGLTVMFTFSASGIITPPMVIYPLKRNRADITASLPPEWGLGLSSNGWMNKDLFFQYITNVLYPYLVKQNTEFPVILFVDGHKSHINFELSKKCKEMGIILIALYPNSTRILQPADVSAFKPIKNAWKKGVLEWRRENVAKNLTKTDFGPILRLILEKYIDKQIIINGFRACGLYPWDPNAINYQKCLGKSVKKPTEISENRPRNAITLKDFEEIVGQNIVSRLISETSEESNDFHKALKKIHDYLKDKHIEQEDNTIENEYLVINDELMPINDMPFLITSSNNIYESNQEPVEIETTTENFDLLLPTDLSEDVEIANLEETFHTLLPDIENTTETKNNNKSQIRENLHVQNNFNKNMLNGMETTSFDVVKGSNKFNKTSLKLTTIAEIHNTEEQTEDIEKQSVQNEELNERKQPNLVCNDQIKPIPEINFNYQNQVTDINLTEENPNLNRDNTIMNSNYEMTPPKLNKTLNWPVTPQRKGKIVSHNPIYVLTSREWLEIEEKKKTEKELKEKEKEERKKKKEEKRDMALKKMTKNAKSCPKNTENINITRQEEEEVSGFALNNNLNSDASYNKNNEEIQIKIKERKRKDNKTTNSTNIKKTKIDNNETENKILKCGDNKTEILDTDNVKKTPKPIIISKTKQSNVEVLSVIKTQGLFNPENIFHGNSCINTKEPFVLPKPKPKPNPILNRRESFRNEEELSSFLNDV